MTSNLVDSNSSTSMITEASVAADMPLKSGLKSKSVKFQTYYLFSTKHLNMKIHRLKVWTWE